VNSNSAIARPNIRKSIGPPFATLGKSAPKRVRYSADAFRRASTAARIGSFRKPLPSGRRDDAAEAVVEGVEVGPIVPAVPVKPATSTSSVGGMWAWRSGDG
jgi:hypothetical protein